MAVYYTIPKIKGSTLTHEEAEKALENLQLPSNEIFENWSSDPNSNVEISELNDGGEGITMNNDLDIYPTVSNIPIIKFISSKYWSDPDFSSTNTVLGEYVFNYTDAQDYGSFTDGAQYVSNEVHYAWLVVPSFSDFLIAVYGENGSPYFCNDFGVIHLADIPEGGYKAYESMDGGVKHFLKIVKTPPNTSTGHVHFYFVYYDQEGNTNTLSKLYIRTI